MEQPTEHTKELYLLGVSFHTAPVAVREALSFNRQQTVALLGRTETIMPGLEAVVLSTCNRTEFYLAAPPGVGVVAAWLAYLRRTRPQAPIGHTDCVRYEQQGTDAAYHLFRVACGLDSSILGDVQIMSQIKEAQIVAAEAGTLGSTLQRVFTQAVHAGKRARRETTISQGAASVGAVLVTMLAEHCRARLAANTVNVLLIGAGAAARAIGQHLRKRRLGRLTCINRTEGKAVELAVYCGGRALPWSALPMALVEADVVIAATAAAQPVLSRCMLEQVAAQRPQRPLLVFDTGVPRNVESDAQVEVIDIDAILERQAEGLAQRQAAIPAAERIVQDEVHAWKQWRASLPLEGLLKRLYQHAASLSHTAAQQVVGLGTPTTAQAEQVIFYSFKQLLHHHVRQLRHHAASGAFAVALAGEATDDRHGE